MDAGKQFERCRFVFVILYKELIGLFYRVGVRMPAQGVSAWFLLCLCRHISPCLFCLVHYNMWEHCWRRCKAPLGLKRFLWVDLDDSLISDWLEADALYWRRAAYQLWAHFHQSSRKSIIVRSVFFPVWRSSSESKLIGFGLHSNKFSMAEIAK